MNSTINFIRGANRKTVASRELETALSRIPDVSGDCFFGYPLIATPDGKFSIDATFVSPTKGIILFDLVEGVDVGEFGERQDDYGNKIEARLKSHRELVQGRKLKVPVHVVTFAPGVVDPQRYERDGYPLANADTLQDVISELEWESPDAQAYQAALSAIESISSIRKSKIKRDVLKEDSRGAKLKRLENAIATLDHRQNRAVIETVEGVQRIRGLAGSGKTIVLVLKAAYLHSQHPDWRIAVTFHTRSLKGQSKRLIHNFCIEQTGEEPDWTKIRVVNAWGAPGDEERDGIYFEFCKSAGVEFFDFRAASSRFGGSDKAFEGACVTALASATKMPEIYDVVLVDEAQDFSTGFLQLCYAIAKEPKRLVYAYDELQSLSGESLPSPEDIFGRDMHGAPLVALGDDGRRDVILQKCYRNSRPLLVSAHGLGFGIYRQTPADRNTGLVQMFDHPRLWEEIGYNVKEGSLSDGSKVVLQRTEESSPKFLEDHSDITDLIQFHEFKSEDEQNAWLLKSVQHNLKNDELRHDDIVVIHPDALTTREVTGPIRRDFFTAGIPCHLAGVDTSADVFFKTETPSVTFTGIFRAKGNEAGMVYIINAQLCNSKGHDLASLRNRLFTAITRSKAWVRVLGYGAGMRALKAEFEAVRTHNFELDFVYPTQDLREMLRVVHRDLSPDDRRRLEQRAQGLSELIQDIETGVIHVEDIDPETMKKLKKLLGGGQ